MNEILIANSQQLPYFSLQNRYGYASTDNASIALKSTTTEKGQPSSDSLMNQLSGLVSLTRYVMDAMGLSSDSKVTFTQLNKYREQQEEVFNTALKTELEKVDVSTIPNFTIRVNDDGTATINSQSEDREKLQKIFDENPDLVKTYKKIEALSGIDKARESMQIAPNEMRKRIQIEAMSAWWAQSASNSGTSFSSYNNGSLSLLQGINVSV